MTPHRALMSYNHGHFAHPEVGSKEASHADFQFLMPSLGLRIVRVAKDEPVCSKWTKPIERE